MFKATVDPQSVAAVILEPVQGEGGFTVMPAEFIRGLKALCEEHGILYIDDEVQAGMGRTGKLWAIEHSGVVPDLMTVGKSLASGMPLAGVIGRAEVIDSVHPGGLGSTYGGNPVACAAAIESIKAISDPAFLAQAVDLRRAHHRAPAGHGRPVSTPSARCAGSGRWWRWSWSRTARASSRRPRSRPPPWPARWNAG